RHAARPRTPRRLPVRRALPVVVGRRALGARRRALPAARTVGRGLLRRLRARRARPAGAGPRSDVRPLHADRDAHPGAAGGQATAREGTAVSATLASTPVATAARPAVGLRVAYVVGRYPAPSHTFIQREIAGLRAAGAIVHPFSIHPPG